MILDSGLIDRKQKSSLMHFKSRAQEGGETLQILAKDFKNTIDEHLTAHGKRRIEDLRTHDEERIESRQLDREPGDARLLDGGPCLARSLEERPGVRFRMVECESCGAKVQFHQFSKHLISHFHYHR